MDTPADDESRIVLHASCVCLDGRGLLILGRSGSGKSALALQMMALGAELVADDRVIVTRGPDGLRGEPPEAIAGLIEARGVGLLRAAYQVRIPLYLVVDLDRAAGQRLPDSKVHTILGHDLPLFFGVDAGYFPSALVQLLKAGHT